MRQIDQRRSIRRTRVYNLKHGLEITIQIYRRTHVALESQRLISVIPPAMWHSMRQPYGLARSKGYPLAFDLGRQSASDDQSFFVLDVVDMQRRTLAMRR